MVNPEKHKPATAEKKLSDDEYALRFAHAEVMNTELIQYIEKHFEKTVGTDDILNVALILFNEIATAESDDDKYRIKKTVCDIVDNKYNLNEFVFTNLAMVKAWNETTVEFKDKNSSKQTEKEFVSAYEKKYAKYEYKAWNDEMNVIKKYSSAKDRLNKINSGV